jgi:isopentenyl-diphosphate delta-isomerase
MIIIMEYVVLIDEKNNEIGIAPKETVHTKDTPLHRGFSAFIFNDKHQLLLTKRASTKKTFPSVWTNTVCGHPGEGETVTDAAKLRLEYELGLVVSDIKEVAPYRYRFADCNGIMENEICPILIGYTNDDPTPETDEVDEWKWIDWEEFLNDIKSNPVIYSPWSREEAEILTDKIQISNSK